MSHKHFLFGLILALVAGGVMLGCNDENPPTAALPDYRPPSVEWIAPSPDADLSGETTLLIAASDDDEVANVAVYLNGQAPDDWRAVGHADSLYSFSWDTRDYPDDQYTLEARAWDEAGNLGISPAMLVRVANDTTAPPAEDNTAPDVWWTAPDPGNVSGEVELNFRVLDDNPLQRVRLYQNGIMPEGAEIAVNDEGVYSLIWNTLADSDGVYAWEARAWDEAGNIGISPALLVRVANDTTAPPAEDNMPPDVWWTAPDPGNVRGEVELAFRVLDDNPLQRVRLYQNGIMPEGCEIAVNGEGAYSLIWNTLADSDGVYSWEARAWDASGNLGTSPALLVRVANDTTAPPAEDRMPPVVAWMSPQPGDTLESVVNLRFQIIDESPIDTAIVFLNGQPWQKLDNLYAFYNGNVIWNTNEMNDGIYLIQIKAVDSARNLAFSEVIRFTVWNNRPRVIWVPDEYATIQGAINASEDGDTVRVRAGTYREGLRLMGKNIWLESEEGAENTVIDADGWEFGIMCCEGESINTVIRGFWIKCDWVGYVGYDETSPRLFNCIFEAQEIATNINISNTEIKNCIMIGGGIGCRAWISWGCVYNTVFMSCQQALRNFAVSQTAFDFGWNSFWGNAENYHGYAPGEGDVYADPKFIEGTFIPSIDSPLVNSGLPDYFDRDSTRSDIGLYGGQYSYITR